MDRPASDVLLKALRVQCWQQAKAQLISLASTVPPGSAQYQELTNVIDQFVDYVESNQLNQ